MFISNSLVVFMPIIFDSEFYIIIRNNSFTLIYGYISWMLFSGKQEQFLIFVVSKR